MIQYVRNGIFYASDDHWVLRSSDNGDTWDYICKIDIREHTLKNAFKDFILRSKFARCLRRNIGIHNVIVLPSGTILIQYDGIYRYDGVGITAKYVFNFSEQKIKGPLINGFIVDDITGRVYFGEYNNDRPYSVRIIRGRDDGRVWDVCYRFDEGAVKHIHSIVPDYYRKRLWICTGDDDNEVGLFYTDDGFATVHRFSGGDQSWRIIGLLPTPNGLIWGSDAGRDAPADTMNYIYSFDFSTSKRERVMCIDKPAYYSMVLADGSMAIATTFEQGMKRNVSHAADVWFSVDGINWECIARFPFSPSGRTNRTKYGTLNFPLGDGTSNDLLITPENIMHYDFCLLKWDNEGKKRK
jgi:hypothetical protein